MLGQTGSTEGFHDVEPCSFTDGMRANRPSGTPSVAEVILVTSHALEPALEVVEVTCGVGVIRGGIAELGVGLFALRFAPWQLDL